GGFFAPGGAGAGGEFSGIRHPARGRADGIAGRGGEVLGLGSGFLNGTGDRFRGGGIAGRPAGLVSRQPALRPGDRTGRGAAVRTFPCRGWVAAAAGAASPMTPLTRRGLIALAGLLLAG